MKAQEKPPQPHRHQQPHEPPEQPEPKEPEKEPEKKEPEDEPEHAARWTSGINWTGINSNPVLVYVWNRNK